MTMRLPKDSAEFARWYGRYFSPVALVAGFVVDTLYLTSRVDLWQTNALLGAYLVLAGLGILATNAIEAGRIRNARIVAVAPFVAILVQFSFGNLFSAYLSLYGRSAAFAGSWVFVALVATLLVGNERFIRLYARVPFQISIYFVVLYSFLIFFLPIIFRSLGTEMFLLAGAASLVLTALFLLALSRVARARMRLALLSTVRSVIIIFLAFNVLYFSNLIPPLPLALKEAGVYHSVERQSGGMYRLMGEALPWYEPYLRYNTVLHLTQGESAYVFTAVFAPTGLSTPIAYEWEHREDGEWIPRGRIAFSIMGGRDGGYRSYSMLEDPEEGMWRVNVLTPDGRIIGRVSFTVIRASTTPMLVVEEG